MVAVGTDREYGRGYGWSQCVFPIAIICHCAAKSDRVVPVTKKCFPGSEVDVDCAKVGKSHLEADGTKLLIFTAENIDETV